MGADEADAKPRPRPRPIPAEDSVAARRRKLGRFFDTGDGETTVVPLPIGHFPGIPPPDVEAGQTPPEPDRPRPSPVQPRRPRPGGAG